MEWNLKGELRQREYGTPSYPIQGVGNWIPSIYIAEGANPYAYGPFGTNVASWHEEHNSMLTVHGKVLLSQTDLSFWLLRPGEVLCSLPGLPVQPPSPVNYSTYQIVGNWAIDTYPTKGGYGLVELTRQYGGTPMLKFLINRYHDASIAILTPSVAFQYYLNINGGSSIMFNVQYPVET